VALQHLGAHPFTCTPTMPVPIVDSLSLAPIEDLTTNHDQLKCHFHVSTLFKFSSAIPEEWSAGRIWALAVRSCCMLKNEYENLLINKETCTKHPELEKLVEDCRREGEYDKLFLVCEFPLRLLAAPPGA
jgi:hypothetical protein